MDVQTRRRKYSFGINLLFPTGHLHPFKPTAMVSKSERQLDSTGWITEHAVHSYRSKKMSETLYVYVD